eukprot:TRINITY_DN9163_c0_g1_i18.p1 TRINITY_DN9163_c0_g1~~TRINITY_DN9163_c0_g1_i18.p1  ORF type:complete len:109 (-),score=11.98 TRINITY_DN9163_c0_g1_i18:8-334(-)
MDEEIIQLPIGDGSSLVGNYSLGIPFFPKVDYDSILPRSYFTEVPHVRQLCNWDCGLACVLMVLRTLGIDHCDIHSLGKLCSTTSAQDSAEHFARACYFSEVSMYLDC